MWRGPESTRATSGDTLLMAMAEAEAEAETEAEATWT